MYFLENNHINLLENFFIGNEEGFPEDQHKQFFDSFDKERIHFFLNGEKRGRKDIIQRKDSAWQQRSIIGVFKNIDYAKKYVTELTNNTSEYRLYRKKLAETHNILSEWNILDLDGNVVENLHSCSMNKCARFGNCPTSYGVGCDIGIGNNTNKFYHIPIIVN